MSDTNKSESESKLEKSAGRAKASLKNVDRMRDDIRLFAGIYKFEPALIAAIISRETSGLAQYTEPGTTGDAGHGHGPMQVDDRSYPDFCADWKLKRVPRSAGIVQGCRVLRDKLAEVKKRWPEVDATEALRRAIAAYNSGTGNVAKCVTAGLDIDARTTGKDYSADVLARAEFFRSAGYAEGAEDDDDDESED